eukprot:TRINITY_DN6352_c0_g1_i1.p1 TRINITY_DN6352_c0_g1~~TRINITY_DN6352_c0_g1_i1.p1  ORF type:complete len:460 (-),score=73.21 TRINITY_DN6352_c0_g1_i1:207-1586(-)
MHPYRKMPQVRIPTSSRFKTSNQEAKEWKDLKYTKYVKTYGAVSHIEFSPIENEFVVTSSSISFYSSSTSDKIKEISKFRKSPYYGTYRKDGKLLAVGGEDPVVKVFEIDTSTALREFRGHTAPIRVVRFSPSDGTKIVSGCDDKTVRTWEINTGDPLSILHGHEDSVRALVPVSGDTWFSGGYDHTIKLWDLRAKQCVRTFHHNEPVESLVFFPENRIASAGGSIIKIWDLGGSSSKEMKTITNHQKTVTSLVYDSQGNNLLSGSLDHLLKVHNLSTYETFYTQPYSDPIISMAFSQDREKLAVGMSSGSVSLRRRYPSEKITTTRKMMEHKKEKEMLYTPEDPENESILEFRQERGVRVKTVERHLQRFEYRLALAEVLRGGNVQQTVSLFAELEHRDGLVIALSGQDIDGVCNIATFLNANISKPAYAPMVVKVANLLIDLYHDVFGLDKKTGHSL